MEKGQELIEYEEDCNVISQSQFEEPRSTFIEEQQPLLLPDPNAPILQGFQQKLKEYLIRVKEQVSDEIAEFRYALKKKKEDLNESGIQLYDLQEQVKHQKTLIKTREEEAHEVSERRQQLQDKIESLKSEYEEISRISKEKKKLCNQRSTALQQSLELEMNIRKWADDADDEVKNAKRAVKKDFQMQRHVSEEKKKSDMMFYKMDVEIRNSEIELESQRNEISKYAQNINNIKNAISQADNDLEVIRNESKTVVKAWQEVILAIQSRDKIIFAINNNITKTKEKMLVCNSAISGIKKQLSKEQAQNKHLVIFHRRLHNDYIALERTNQEQNDAYKALKTKLEKLPLLIEQTKKDLRDAKTENNVLTAELNRLEMQLEKKSSNKYELEESILKLAEDQIITDNANQFRVKLFTASQDKRRNLELRLSQTTNQLSNVLLEMEKCKSMAYKLRKEGEKFKTRNDEVEKNYNFMELALKSLQTDIEEKLKRNDAAARALNELVQKKSEEISPTEAKIKMMEKDISIISKEASTLEALWVTVQNHYVHLSQRRDQQLSNLIIAEKQLSIIKQKAMKIDFQLEELDAYINDLNNEIKTYKKKVEFLNVMTYKKISQHEMEEKGCLKEHQELIQVLKDTEMSVLRLEEDVKDFENEVETLKDMVLSKHKEALFWEAKYKMVEETLRWYKNQTCMRSDISQIKTEIHRMEVRYNQLKRAQEKLVQDVEQTVMHREQIYESSNTKRVKEAQSLRFKKNTVTALQHKILEWQQKIKHVQRDIKIYAEEHLDEMRREYEKIKTDIQNITAKINEESRQEELLKKSIDESFLLKHLNLETIIRKQNRSKSYRRLGIGIPKTTRSESTMMAQNKKLMDVNEKLTEILQILIEKYPEQRHSLCVIAQTLKE